MECGCYNHIDQDPTKTRIVYCALHAAAQDMLEACEAALSEYHPTARDGDPIAEQLLTVIAKAKGENS